MGKVIRLDAPRAKRSASTRWRAPRTFAGFAQDALRATCHIVRRGAALIGRIAWLTSIDILITLLALFVKPLRILTKLIAIAVLFAALFAFLDHGKHLQFLFSSIGVLAFISALNACFKHALANSNRAQFHSRGL
jgi:hypothetical protein